MLCVAILMSLGQAARHLPFPFDKIYKQWAIPSNVKRQVALHRDLTEVAIPHIPIQYASAYRLNSRVNYRIASSTSHNTKMS